MERNHIEVTPGICGGKPHISGHRIRVQDIVIWHEKKVFDKEIRVAYIYI